MGYFLRGALVLLAGVPAVLISEFAVYFYFRHYSFDISTFQGFSLFQVRIERFIIQFAPGYLFTLFSTVFGTGLAGIAIGGKGGFAESAGYALRHLHHIFLAVSLLYLGYFFALEETAVLQSGFERRTGNPAAWVEIADGALLAWLNLMVSIAIITESYREMSARSSK
jgi:hypothetical protein